MAVINSPNSCPFHPARRVEHVEEYYFSRKLKEVARLNAAGRDIISLAVGGPDRLPPAEAVDTLRHWAAQQGVHSYQPYVGIPELRRAYADWYGRHFGVTLNADTELLPLIGSKEGILHVTLAFVNPGEGVLVPNPGYPTYSSVARLAEARLLTYELTEQNRWEPDFDALERMDLSGVRLMWVNYPHMPTGHPASPELLRRLVDFGRRHAIVIAADNPYSFILNDRPLSILAIEGARDVAVELNSLSKSHNMAGWRMGMVASNPTFIDWILRVKSNVDSGQYRPMMLAAAAAMQVGPQWYADLNAEYRVRRVAAEAVMDALGCRLDSVQQGLFLWGRVPDGWESGEQLADAVLDCARVFIVPGSVFGSAGRHYVRLSLCSPADVIDAARHRIQQAALVPPQTTND